jgi:NADH-quinone oxidoreductase subunit M
VAVLLVGVLDKVGTFGMITLCLPLFPDASRWAAPVVLALAVVSVLYGALLAIGQKDLIRLIAYTSVSHFGLIVLGVFAFTSTAQKRLGAVHAQPRVLDRGPVSWWPGCWSPAGAANRSTTTAGSNAARRCWRDVPAGGAVGDGPPGMSTFVSEILVLVGAFQRYPVAAVLAAVGMVLAALYILLAYQRMCTGPASENTSSWRDLSVREVLVVTPLIAAIIALGVYPKPVLDVLDPVSTRTAQVVGFEDPEPTVPVAHQAGGSK